MEKNLNESYRVLRRAVLCSGAWLLVLVFGYCFPTGSTWGFHSFGYLPLPVLVVFMVLSTAVLLFSFRVNIWNRAGIFHEFAWRRPVPFLLIVVSLFILLSYLARVRLPLLGDSFTLVNNLENTLAGRHPLGTGNEPLSMEYLYAVARLFGASGPDGIRSAVLAGEMILGAIFLASVYFTVRELFSGKDDPTRSVVFFLLVTISYIQLFFGYIEVYAVVLTLLSVTILAVTLHIRGKIPYWILPPLFILLVLGHYLGALLLPAVAYLGWAEARRGGWKQVTAGVVIGVLVFAVTALLLKDWSILPDNRHSPFVPVAATDAYSSYTMFSLPHLLDLFNLAMLTFASPLCLLLVSRGKFLPGGDRVLRTLAVGFAPVLVFIVLSRFDLGMAKDWDIITPFAYVACLYALLIFLRAHPAGIRALGVVMMVSLVSTSAFVLVNARDDASLARVRSFLDPELTPPSGIYQTSFHLSMVYLERREIGKMVTLWTDYVSNHPGDSRGYQKLAKSYWEFGEAGYDSVLSVFDRWLRAVPADTGVPRLYADMCMVAGTASLRRGRMAEAGIRLERAVMLNPWLARGYAKLGVLHLGLGEPGKAEWNFRKALGIDGRDAGSCRQMGSIFLNEGSLDSALAYASRAVNLNPFDTLNSLLLAKTFEARGEIDSARSAWRNAARLGSREALKRTRQN